MTTQDAYDDGAAAYRDGKPRHPPYSDAYRRDAWREGWDEAHEMDHVSELNNVYEVNVRQQRALEAERDEASRLLRLVLEESDLAAARFEDEYGGRCHWHTISDRIRVWLNRRNTHRSST